MKKIELLAPAGDRASVLAAINGGADAVYVGEKSFSARRRAGNFSLKELEDILTLCHSQGVKVYLAMNILIKDAEFEEVIETLNHLGKMDIDGLILQDLGLIELIRNYYPMFSMQTSTQGSVYGLQGVKYFENLGFQRIVLPREMPIKEIARIREETAIELKIFIHGALCYAYSGQCLMSALIGGRSGNRGLCAQPCRKNYTLYDKHGKFIKSGTLISTKDLNTLDRIQEIVTAGVDALKIEGRMKQPAYVYAVTQAYRNALDGKTVDANNAIKMVFNRDFTSGLLFEDTQTLNQQIAKNKGRHIGIVEVSDPNKLVLRLKKGETLQLGDGIAFGQDQKIGGMVERLENMPSGCVALPPNPRVQKQMKVFKTKDETLESTLTKAALKPISIPKQPLSLHLVLREGQPIDVQVLGDFALNFEVPISPQEARNRSIDLKFIENQLEKLGDTPYTLKKLTVDLEEGLFLKKSELNALRREIVSRLRDNRKNEKIQYPTYRAEDILPKRCIRSTSDVQIKKQLSLELRNSIQLDHLPDVDLDEVVVPVYDYRDIEMIRANCQGLRDKKIDLNIAFPRIVNTNTMEKLDDMTEDLKRLNPDRVLAKNYDVLHWLTMRKLAPIQGDSSLNIFNNLAIDHLEKDGVASVVLSMELEYAQIQKMTEVLRKGFRYTLPVYGYSEMMVTDHCPFACKERQCDHCQLTTGARLRDEKNQDFLLYKDPLQHLHLYNSHVFALYRELNRLPYCDEWRIYWTKEKRSEIENIILEYRKEQPWKSDRWIKALPNRTRGLIHRGVH